MKNNTPVTLVALLLALLAFGCSEEPEVSSEENDPPAEAEAPRVEPAPRQTPLARFLGPVPPGSTLADSPQTSPWSQLPDMPDRRMRFQLASEGGHIYLLGGTTGGPLSRGLLSYDPGKGTWRTLQKSPLPTGYGFLAAWPGHGKLVTLAGIDRLGDSFTEHGVRFGIYDIETDAWEQKKASGDSLERVSCLAHAEGNLFLLLSGETVSTLNAGTGQLSVTGSYPAAGRLIAWSRLGQSLFVMHSESRESSTLHVFDLAEREHVYRVELPEAYAWTDKLFTWNGQLLLWKNSGDTDRNHYPDDSKLLLMDPAKEAFVELHPQHPAPRARRSSAGVVHRDAFYTFGGQREDNNLLQGVNRYRFAPD